VGGCHVARWQGAVNTWQQPMRCTADCCCVGPCYAGRGVEGAACSSNFHLVHIPLNPSLPRASSLPAAPPSRCLPRGARRRLGCRRQRRAAPRHPQHRQVRLGRWQEGGQVSQAERTDWWRITTRRGGLVCGSGRCGLPWWCRRSTHTPPPPLRRFFPSPAPLRAAAGCTWTWRARAGCPRRT
jgi:hypothetical protein